ncbi:MAG: hypothetical protein M3352_12895 [Bacteroidota bacterium]|nr:hypothetical protein [Bacteroidota bacterium]
MKKYFPYILVTFIVIALGILLISPAKKRPRKMDERITLRKQDKIPYGFYAARNLLPSLFPLATVYSDKRSPGYWDSISSGGKNQAVFLICRNLNADEDELKQLLNFAKKGNYIFIICKYLSYEATRFFGFDGDDLSEEDDFVSEESDNLGVQLVSPRFNDFRTYVYPGKRYAGYFKKVNKNFATVLGENGLGYPNFIQFKTGSGAVFIHTVPLAFSNYFILHKNNMPYFQQVLSVIPGTVKKVLWNEYYLNKRYDQPQSEPGWLRVLLKHEPFRWALLTAMATLILFVLLEMRRKQRLIPVVEKPKNDSLDFVQTIGRLYYDKKDHKDLAKKMGVYFLDHVRNRYKLTADTLDDGFINALHLKTGYGLNKIKNIVDFILHVEQRSNIKEQELADFHNQLEFFYKNT